MWRSEIKFTLRWDVEFELGVTGAGAWVSPGVAAALDDEGILES
jgi:hypothetical protein